MNRNVEVNVTGIHSREGEPTEKVESLATGIYELQNDGSVVVEYDEEQDTGAGTMKIHNRVLIGADGQKMEIVRGGATTSTLAFAKDLEYETEYNTPYGTMQMKVRTISFDFNRIRGDEEIKVVADYDLEIGGQVVSKSMIVIDIKNAVAS
jgi:uncharacterized beta-barrel protein YwiB (DUF1934 family)